jgi:hypothetical protein
VDVNIVGIQAILLVTVLSDIITNPADAGHYSVPTQELAKIVDLRHRIILAGSVTSCPNFDPTTYLCSGLDSPPALQTDQGDFYLYEPYYNNGDPYNWAVFWLSKRHPGGND